METRGEMQVKKVIAIVEDEKDLNELVKRYLEKEGYEVRSYLTYEEASAHTSDDDVHCWILDIMLDDKSGFDLIEEIRMQSPEVPVVFMSARDKEFDRIIGLEKGSDDYITKPFSPKELVARIKAVMRRISPMAVEEVIEMQGLSLDPTSHRVMAGEEPLEMGPTEFKLLHFFMTHPERVYSREQLLNHVWGTNVYVEDRTVDVHIRRLRKALEPGGHDRMVQTVRGTGYRFSTRF